MAFRLDPNPQSRSLSQLYGGGCMTYIFLTRRYEFVPLLPRTRSTVVRFDSVIKADCSCVLQLQQQQQPLQEAQGFGTQIPGK